MKKVLPCGSDGSIYRLTSLYPTRGSWGEPVSDFIYPEDARLIPLVGKNGIGKFGIVDAGMYDLVIQHRWTMHSQGYVVRYESERNRTIAILLHHVILGRPENDMVVDHRNGNRVDNRLCNLRFVTRTGNSQNARPRKPNKHGLLGVQANKSGTRFRAYIWQNKVKHKSEWLDTPMDAHLRYLEMRRELHGEFDPALRQVV